MNETQNTQKHFARGQVDARIYHIDSDENFVPQYTSVYWVKDEGARKVAHGTSLYAPSTQAKSWDGADWASHAVGVMSLNDYPAFSYCTVRKTGRDVSRIPHSGGVYGVKAQITFNAGTSDENTFQCWIVNH